MKKEDRKQRSEVKAEQKAQYHLQEKTCESFFAVCKSCFTNEQWNSYYQEGQAIAGETLHIFEYLVFGLAESQIPIEPPLRKAIDAVLKVYDLNRENIEHLDRLNYDKFWKEQYGYR